MPIVDARPAQRVLVTGAAGFIGSHLTEALAIEGRDVFGLDNFDPYYDVAEKRANAAAIEAAGASLIELDIGAVDRLGELMGALRPEVVVHLAAKAGVRASVDQPREYFDVNLVGTQNVIDACRAHGVNRLVFASTSSVYGHTRRVPFDEADPCSAPLHPYGATKRSAELLIQTYARLYGLQATVLRLFTVYGRRGRPDMMPRMLLDSVTSGTPVSLFDGPLERDWTHISDIVEGLRQAVDRPMDFEILNLGRGMPVPLREFIDELHAASGRRANLVDTPRPASAMLTTYADNRRLADLLGVKPVVSVAEGVADLWRWWEARHTSSAA